MLALGIIQLLGILLILAGLVVLLARATDEDLW